MKDIIAIKYNLNTQRDYLKLKLEQKELVEYSTWRAKEENTTNREAIDKVVARLKLEDESWMLEEADLIELKNKATLVGNIYDTLMSYLTQQIPKESVDRIANEYIEEFDLGEYL
jgi:uncharacterized protein YdaL